MPSTQSLADSGIATGARLASLGETPSNPSVGTQESTSVATCMANLLPLTGSDKAFSAAGVYIREGFPPVPEKLAWKIRQWEYVDTAELLPEYLRSVAKMEEGSSSTSQGATLPRRRRNVIKLSAWLQCFATYVSVMSSHHPTAVLELLVYMICVLRASQVFARSAWVTYDNAFRRQAASTGNRAWSVLTPHYTPYALRARPISASAAIRASARPMNGKTVAWRTVNQTSREG